LKERNKRSGMAFLHGSSDRAPSYPISVFRKDLAETKIERLEIASKAGGNADLAP
jgi:hypothetical protein